MSLRSGLRTAIRPFAQLGRVLEHWLERVLERYYLAYLEERAQRNPWLTSRDAGREKDQRFPPGRPSCGSSSAEVEPPRNDGNSR